MNAKLFFVLAIVLVLFGASCLLTVRSFQNHARKDLLLSQRAYVVRAKLKLLCGPKSRMQTVEAFYLVR